MDGWQRVGALTRPSVLTQATVPPEAHWTCDLIRIQNVRLDDQNLYFNAESSWRWCEFSAHPRVMVYADQTGAELTDIRVRGGAAPWLPPCPPVSSCVLRVLVLVLPSGTFVLFPFQEKAATSHTLFQISNTSDCRRGERLSLSRYLGQVHPFHHLVTTQVTPLPAQHLLVEVELQEEGAGVTDRGGVRRTVAPSS